MGIELGTSTTAVLMGNVTALFVDFSDVITLIIGITLSLFIVSMLIGTLHKNDPVEDRNERRYNDYY